MFLEYVNDGFVFLNKWYFIVGMIIIYLFVLSLFSPKEPTSIDSESKTKFNKARKTWENSLLIGIFVIFLLWLSGAIIHSQVDPDCDRPGVICSQGDTNSEEAPDYCDRAICK